MNFIDKPRKFIYKFSKFIPKLGKLILKLTKYIPKLFGLYLDRSEKELCEARKIWNEDSLSTKISKGTFPIGVHLLLWHYAFQDGLLMSVEWRLTVYAQDVAFGAWLYMHVYALVNATVAYASTLIIVWIFGSFLFYAMRRTAYRKPEDKGLANARHRPNGDHVLLLLFMLLSFFLFIFASTYFITTRSHIVWYVYSFVSVLYHIFYDFIFVLAGLNTYRFRIN